MDYLIAFNIDFNIFDRSVASISKHPVSTDSHLQVGLEDVSSHEWQFIQSRQHLNRCTLQLSGIETYLVAGKILKEQHYDAYDMYICAACREHECEFPERIVFCSSLST